MLRLDLKPLPTWHDLTPGLRVQLAPLTTALMVAARSQPLVKELPEGASAEEAALAMAKALATQGVTVTELFYPPDYQPPLGHEYQFNLDTEAGRQALDRSVVWLGSL